MAKMVAGSGDSGSVTLSVSNKIVGLNFAASINDGTIAMTPIETVLKYFNLDIYTGSLEV